MKQDEIRLELLMMIKRKNGTSQTGFTYLWLSLILCVSVTGCSSAVEPTLSPEQAAGTAIVAQKYTEIAEATLYPAIPSPTEVYPTMDWSGWTPSPGEIVASDSGKAYSFVLTSRFSIVLKEADFPAANLKLNCIPDIVLGRISNVEPAPPDYYVIRYEGSGFGQCIIQNGSFEVTVNIIDHP